MQKIRRFLRFPLTDQTLLLKTTVWILGVRAALSVFSFQTVRAYLARVGTADQQLLFETETPSIQKLIWAVDVTSHYLLRDRPCLTKALVAQMFLSRRGYQTTLRIGVAHNAPRSLQAHAWLERDGAIVIGHLNDIERYTPLPPL